MKEIRFWVIMAATLAVGILLWILNPKIPDGVGTYVLLLTLVAVMLYTRETHRLRLLSTRQIEVSQDQLELNQRPHLEVVFKRAHFRLHNIGYGPATNIKIDPAIVHIESIPPLRLKFACPPVVRKDEYQPIEIKILWAKTDGPALDISPGVYTPPLATETMKIRIHYENLSGKPYDRELVLGKDMPIVSDQVAFLLQYLYEQAPKGVYPLEIPDLYVRRSDLYKHLKYCLEKKFIDSANSPGDLWLYDQKSLDVVDQITITADGVDFLKRT